MAYGIKVSKPGVDAYTAETEDLFMDTTYPLLKVERSGSGSLSVSDGGSDSDTISHNLGYVPKVLVYGQVYSVNSAAKISEYQRFSYQDTALSGTIYSFFSYTLDSSDLVIQGTFSDGTSNSGTFNYFYYIFYNEE